MRLDVLKRLMIFLYPSGIHEFNVVRQRPLCAEIGAEQSADVRLHHGGVIPVALQLDLFLQGAAQGVPAVEAVTEQDVNYFPAALLIALPDDGKKTASVSS